MHVQMVVFVFFFFFLNNNLGVCDDECSHGVVNELIQQLGNELVAEMVKLNWEKKKLKWFYYRLLHLNLKQMLSWPKHLKGLFEGFL